MSEFWHFMVGRTEIATLNNRLYISNHPNGKPMKWRLIISTTPHHPRFSERYGYTPPPRTGRLWPFHTTYYPPREDRT